MKLHKRVTLWEARMIYAGTEAPYQHVCPRSLICELHCPSVCKNIGRNCTFASVIFINSVYSHVQVHLLTSCNLSQYGYRILFNRALVNYCKMINPLSCNGNYCTSYKKMVMLIYSFSRKIRHINIVCEWACIITNIRQAAWYVSW